MPTAHALWFVEPRRVEVRQLALPEPRDGQVLVHTRYSGISAGTEMLAYRGELDPRLPMDEALGALGGTFTYPFRYGYSCVGRVERSHGRIREGEAVFAFHPHQDMFVIDEAEVVALDGDPHRTVTLLPLVETALQVTLDAAVPPGGRAVVVGLGTVGILVAALLCRSGVGVLAADPLPWRRAIAARLGVRVVEPSHLRDEVQAWAAGRGADVAVEASGNPEAPAAVLPLLGHEGTLLVCSWYGTKEVRLPLGAEFHRRRLVIRSSQVSSIPSALAGRWDRARRREAATSLLRELPLSELATHEFPFARAAEAYAAIDQPEEGLVHAALRYD